MFLLKNFEKIFYKIFNYLIILSLYFLYAQNSYSEENILALIIFLYLKDICLSNYFISELFIRNYRILKNKTDFFHTLFKLIILILILFFIISIFFSSVTFTIFYFFLILFTILNSILLLLIKKKLLKIIISLIKLLTLTFIFYFRDHNLEIFLFLLCCFELIIITLSSNIKFSQIKKIKPFNDMRCYYFFKKFFINLIISDFYKFMFLIFLICFFSFEIIINFNLIFISIILIEIGDFFSFIIKQKYQKILEINNQIQKKSSKQFNEIFNLVIFYFIIFTLISFLFVLINEIEFKLLAYFLCLFYFYNLEKLRNLLIFTKEQLIIYKKHFIYNFIAIFLAIIFLSQNIYLKDKIILENLNVLFFSLIIFEVIYLKIVRNYISV